MTHHVQSSMKVILSRAKLWRINRVWAEAEMTDTLTGQVRSGQVRSGQVRSSWLVVGFESLFNHPGSTEDESQVRSGQAC